MLFLLLGALCITSAPLLVRYVESGASFIGFVRCFSGAIFLSWALFKDRKILISQVLNFKSSKWLFLAGAAFYFDLLVWHNSIYIIGAGKATVLGNTQIFYLTILGIIFYKEKVNKVQVVSSVIALLGITVMIGGESVLSENENYSLGVIYGLSTGVFYSIYIFSLSKLARTNKTGVRLSDASKLCLVCLTSSVLFLPTSILDKTFHMPDANDLISLLALGLFAQVIGWLSIKKGLATVPVAIGGLILLLQPVLATIFSHFIFDESLSIVQISGLICAIAGIALGTLKRENNK